MAKDCPKCGSPNMNDAVKCKKCEYFFGDRIISNRSQDIKCPYCGTLNSNWFRKCEDCNNKVCVSKSKYENKKSSQEYNKKTILFDCVAYHNKFTINVDGISNVFICQNCSSIFSYEWKDNKLIIHIVKKEDFIPKNIKILIEYFNLEQPIELDNLKKNYHGLLSKYHPDKVTHLADEFKELSEKRTKEIIKNYELLQDWIKIRK
jgi:hypothetical protein